MDEEPRRSSWWERAPGGRRITIIVCAVLVFILIWWLLPELLYLKTSDEAVRVKAITDTRTALLAGLVGIGALGTFWMNSRNVRLTAKTLGLSEANLRLAERGHLTDRYAKAIEQVGDDKLDVRLGGIYALEQLAADSRRDRDQATIVEVLSAFVRVHSDPVYRLRQHRSWLGQDQLEEAKEEQCEAKKHVREFALPVDVQAAVTVLGRLPDRPKARRADLSGACLRKVKLDPKANLTNAMLGDEADLTGAKLVAVDLAGVDLHRANLTRARLEGAKLPEAWLAGAHLNEAHLVGADLTGAKLSGIWVNDKWYDLEEARQKLSNEDLSQAAYSQADLSGADLSDAIGLRQHQIDAAQGNDKTKLPEELHRPESWAQSEALEPG